MFALIYETIIDAFLGFRYFLKSLATTVLFLFIIIGLPDLESAIFNVVAVIGVVLLSRLFLREFFGKTKIIEKICETIVCLTIIWTVAYLAYNFDIDFFKENLAEFIKEFKNMIETGKRIFRIIFYE